MNKRYFTTFLVAAVVLGIVIPFWAYSKDGSAGSSPHAVAAGDESARELFETNCGTCHTLARAGSDGVVGPDLDVRLAAGGPATDEESIKSLQSRVLGAIENGVGEGAMPAGILEGSSATKVANFVARQAGR